VTNSRQPGLFDTDETPAPAAPAPIPPAPPAATTAPAAASGPLAADDEARRYAMDPRHNVVLEASAGTGKTTVLVNRYLNLLGAGIDPANILAITFTRKAAAEMRERIIAELRRAAALNDESRRRWLALRDRVADIAISTIDAFCYALLREFPLEAGLAPGFSVADETEAARLAEESIDRALARCRAIAASDAAVGLVLTRITPPRLRTGLAHLVDRRLVAPTGLRRYLHRTPERTPEALAERATARFRDALDTLPGGLPAFLVDGPVRHPRFGLVAADLRAIAAGELRDPSQVAIAAETLRFYFLTQKGTARTRGNAIGRKEHAPSEAAWKRHTAAVCAAAPLVEAALRQWATEVNALLARGVSRVFAIALEEHRRTLAEHDVVDFPELIERAVQLLRQMDEFSQSRYRLESRYHHVLVDEFQDTSRLQWELVALLVQSWGEGFGLVHDAPLLPSLFIVGDRKQSIYRFRDADVTLLDQAAATIRGLRADGDARRSITRSFRSRPELLAFVNDVCGAAAASAPSRPEAFRYDERDRFPIEEPTAAAAAGAPPLGLIVGEDSEGAAALVAAEIARLLETAIVRDRATGVPRPAEPGDIAILFRSRDAHREFERALEARHVPAYVYKGLGFFDADEIKDVVAIVRFLAAPASDLRAAALLRSRLVGLSDHALARLAPDLAGALVSPEPPVAMAALDPADVPRLAQARAWIAGWLPLVDRLPPADVLDHVLADAGYADVLAGVRRDQARENVKKLRALARRVGNRGYATMARLAAHVDRLATGDEAHAVREAVRAVNLMTVHASKGLEFPIVFVVNLGRGVMRRRPPVRVHLSGDDDERGDASVSIESFMSEQDTLEPELEREESKRLLYVALTRARDRLYLSAAAKDGQLKPGPGSLAQLLPSGLVDALSGALTLDDGAPLTWTGPSRTHALRVARPPLEAVADTTGRGEREAPVDDAAEPGAVAPRARLEPALPRQPVTAGAPAAAIDAGGGDDAAEASGDAARRLVGRLVHRLLERFRPGVAAGPSDLAAAAAALVSDEDRATVADLDAAIEKAVVVHRRLAARADLIALFADGTAAFEVPLSFLEDGRVLRGTIDCLIRRPGGDLVVIEIKTGPPRPEHERQLDAYLAAIRAVEPGIRATGCLVHP
jgi:ATP-dependent helicase/nuclease subunit A